MESREISQNSQENNCAKVSFLKYGSWPQLANSLTKRLWHRCFMKILRNSKNTFFIEHLLQTASDSKTLIRVMLSKV